MSHTKPPWKATYNPFVNDPYVYITEKNLSIADGKIALVENMTDAEYIVECVNERQQFKSNYRELIRHAKKVNDSLVRSFSKQKNYDEIKEDMHLVNNLQAAIRKLEYPL